MSIIFPSYVPSQREFTLNNYPVKIYRTLSGATAKRSFGNKPYSYRLSLQFTNVTDDITFGILDHYEQTSAGFFRFSLPSSLFNGISDPLAGRMRSPSHILWEYESPPVLQSIHTGITTVSVRLIGELDVDAPAGGGGGGGDEPDLFIPVSEGFLGFSVTLTRNQSEQCSCLRDDLECAPASLSTTQGEYYRTNVASYKIGPTAASATFVCAPEVSDNEFIDLGTTVRYLNGTEEFIVMSNSRTGNHTLAYSDPFGRVYGTETDSIVVSLITE